MARVVTLKQWQSFVLMTFVIAVFATRLVAEESQIPQLPSQARLVLSENWNSGKLDSKKWYLLRRKWGNGNHGVIPENVYIEKDIVAGMEQNVVVCRAQGDAYDGDHVVPSMAAQLNLGIWLPDWAGPADWKTAEVRFANIQIWQYEDEGDLRGLLSSDIPDNFDPQGNPLKSP